jgi:AcrR family transcriptional regulator
LKKNIAAPVPKKRNATKGARTRVILKQIARTLFERDGHSGVSAQAIVEAAGISSGTFYIYFTNKDEILFEISRDFLDEIIARLAVDRIYTTDFENICLGHYIYIKSVSENWDFFRALTSYSFANTDLLEILRGARLKEAERTAAYFLTRWNQLDRDAPEVDMQGAVKMAMALHAMTEGYLQDELTTLPLGKKLDEAEMRELALYVGRLFYRAAFLEKPPEIQFNPINWNMPKISLASNMGNIPY